MEKEDVCMMFKAINAMYGNKLKMVFVTKGYKLNPKSNGCIDLQTGTIKCNWEVLKNKDFYDTLKFLLHEVGHHIQHKLIIEKVGIILDDINRNFKKFKGKMLKEDFDKAMKELKDSVKVGTFYVDEQLNHKHYEEQATILGRNFYSKFIMKGGIQNG